MDRHAQTATRISHRHDYGEIDAANERRTLLVVLLTGTMMAVEILAGYLTGSMALLADGWHMGTHTFALGISYTAYHLARKHQRSQYFSFGTGKFGVLAGYTSAILLALAAVWMIYESVHRIINPVQIAFTEAILVTAVGLAVNFVSVLILHQPGHHHDHQAAHYDGEVPGKQHSPSHSHAHHDHNYRAAYLHVLADTLTSVFALVALLAGRFLGWAFLDPVMGIVGGILISRWAYMLLKTTGIILLDGGMDEALRQKAKALLEADNESRVTDLHVWRVGSKEVSLIASVVTGTRRQAAEYRMRLQDLPELSHVTIEVHFCEDPDCPCAKAAHSIFFQSALA